MKVMNKDSHTLCPVSDRSFLPLAVGTKVKLNGTTFTVTGSTPYMAYFKGQKFEVKDCSKINPVEIDITINAD